MPKLWDDHDTRTQRAHLMFHVNRINGYVNMIDAPQPYDPDGTVVAVIVDVKRERVIRCALNRQQAKNLASKLMEAL